MKTKKFIDLRKQSNLSQDQIADSLYISTSTIRRWEHGETIPSIEDIKGLAKVLNVAERELLEIFSPDEIKVEEDKKKFKELFEFIENKFWETKDFMVFKKFVQLYSIGNTFGIANCMNNMFYFSKVCTERYKDGVVLGDNSDNYIIFTKKNVIDIAPMSSSFGIYTFEIVTRCPMFPIDIKQITNLFEQKIYISLINR